jgi:hypothetical protein|tara:strand:- start:276 stop:725 length:450 start_codon:yes stop_codon:yes gene_type:complete
MEYSEKQKKAVGKRLKDIRCAHVHKGRTLNQAEFGGILGLKGSEKEIQAKISKWETGRINVPMEYIGIYSNIGGKTLDALLASPEVCEQDEGLSGNEVNNDEELRMFLKDLVVAQAKIIELQDENKSLREELNSGGSVKKAPARGKGRS